MTLAPNRNIDTTDEIPTIEPQKPVHDCQAVPNNSVGTSTIRSLKKKIRVEGTGLSEIAIPLDLRREAMRMANLVANKWVEESDTTPRQ